MNEKQKKQLEEMGKDKRKHFQVLSTLTGVDSKLLIASYEEGHMTGAQDAWEMREAEITALKKRIAQLEDRKCSHGDYRLYGTTDCKNEIKCGGRADLYVIGDGLCVSCNLSGRKAGSDE